MEVKIRGRGAKFCANYEGNSYIIPNNLIAFTHRAKRFLYLLPNTKFGQLRSPIFDW